MWTTNCSDNTVAYTARNSNSFQNSSECEYQVRGPSPPLPPSFPLDIEGLRRSHWSIAAKFCC